MDRVQSFFVPIFTVCSASLAKQHKEAIRIGQHKPREMFC